MMNRVKTIVTVACLLGFSAPLATDGQTVPKTVLMSSEVLAKTKARLANGDAELMPAMKELLKDADAALGDGPYSVTNKTKVAPSGNKHDYASYGRYWWPDPNKPDGLPYVRRDGETNPDSQSAKKSDRPRIEKIGNHTQALGLAYYLTGEEKYAVKAAELLRVWFLDPATRMNPNMNFAQGRPGHTDGSKSGVLDGRMMTKAFEGSLLIAGSSALTDAEREGLKAWAAEYLKWLTTADLAIQEAAAKNNHGSYYDAQTMYIALYCGDKEQALKIANAAAKKRILSQIKPDGSMPEEMARTRPLFYSNYNLHAMFLVAYMSKKLDVDLWSAGDSRLRAGLDFLTPYTDSNKTWPTPTVSKADPMKMFPILLMANDVYPQGNYLRFLDNLPASQRKVRRENLAFPLMR